ncbi:DUF433 domain-containing protein [Natrialba sp. INN-245]|uniref:DUF433 domain-containing protein n=1 Tax=Natrialba sp. INN-245 TaxID=2690967 RepID=UPI0013132C5B|nr:DUF433 domain-containing protein [Natrialba sp. INN-245]MWV41031.1 DUF433 domain-containing protein [Natrialba sp. INN-245]
MATIVQTDDILGGEPRIDGTRVGVLDVYELVIDGGNPPADVADQLDRSLGEIYTALAYYHEHPEEMRQLRRERDEVRAELAESALQPPEPAQ